MSRRLLSGLALGLAATLAPAAGADEPLKVLFLGDRGHHAPADRFGQLAPALQSRGIASTYTEDVGDLDHETLAKYDALLVYANIERIAPEQEKALLDYVAGGGGFVPIHCASFCFLNSEAYVEMVGAQFQRHGTGEFETKVVEPAHPTMKGLEPFRTWDETYVHHRHNPEGRTVLQVRAEGDGEEPWTWTRTHGEGRVFYTAYGHDQRTFGNPGFHDLVERGIRWAAGKGEVFDSRPRVASGLEPFRYAEAAAGIPNYLPGAQWGTQGEPARRMQLAAPPEESARHMALPPGFEVELFASEPDIAKPICLAWDHRGRLWVAETVDYPNDLRRGGGGNDRITICEDTDGDGRADTFKVFADGLSIPTSIAFARGGVVVHQLPDTLFLKDTDGDDRADVREVLFTGWGTGDTHAGPSNLRYGLDGWLYGIVGYSGFRGTVGGEELRFGQGFYRFRPDGSELEFLRSTSNNSWGVGFSEEGLLFGSTANGCPSVFLPIPNRYYESVRGASARVLRSIADSNRFWPVTDRVRQVDFHGGFTAAAGHAIYTARAYPEHYWNSAAFVAEPTGHLVATFALRGRGADFASHNVGNLLASDDEWTAPVAAEVGPDGQVWVIDWYNYIVQHNPTPQGFKTGRGAAYETPLRDKTHGRIYRVVYRGGRPTEPVRLDPDDPATLVEGLRSDNQLWRMHAQRLLVERGGRDAVAGLVGLVKDRSVDAIGLNAPAIHAAWALRQLGALDGAEPDAAAVDAVASALGHPSAGVRRAAIQALPADERSTARLLAAGVLGDPEPQVRLAALLALVDAPRSAEAGSALAGAIAAWPRRPDPTLVDAATAAAAAHDLEFLRAIARAEAGPAALEVAGRVAEHHARGGPAGSVGDLIAILDGAGGPAAEAIVAGLAKGWPQGAPAEVDAEAERALARLAETLPRAARGRLIGLASRWGSRELARRAEAISSAFLATVSDESAAEADRIAAARQLVELRGSEAEPIGTLLDQLTPRTPPTLAAGIVEAVGRGEAAGAGGLLLDRLDTLTPAVRRDAVRALLGRAEWTAALLDALEAGKVRAAELALDQKQALASHPDRRLAGRARRLLAADAGLPDPDRQKVIDALAPVVLAGGDVARGKVVYRDQCAKCHVHGGEGGKVGPDLSGMATHPAEELLVHILDPSRSVEGNYVQYTVATVDGRVLNGLLASETRTTLELLDAEGKTHVVQRDEIDELVASKKSLMPEGFENQVSPGQLADLLAFLTDRGKYLPIDLAGVATVVTTRGMFHGEEVEAERLVFADWGPKVVEGVPFQLVDPKNDRTPNAVLLHGPQGATPPKMPRSVSVPCRVPARAIHILGGVAGWGFPYGDKGSTSMIVRLRYADGQSEDHPLRNGEAIADYIRPVEVPGSKLAFRLGGRQLRYLAVHPRRAETIEAIELVKGDDDSAPIVMGLTVEVAGSE